MKAKVPTDAELRRLQSVVKDSIHGMRDAAIVAMSYRAGLRAKELAGLRICDVWTSTGQIEDECELTSAMTKAGKPRILYLTNPLLRNALFTYLTNRREVEDILFNREAPLFATQKTRGFNPNTMQQLLHRLHDRAGIKGGRSHSGRRWFATELIAKGVDIKAVSVLMGHAGVGITATYAEDNPQRLRRIAAELV